jgi:flagellar basal-body rod modification protein FlgD
MLQGVGPAAAATTAVNTPLTTGGAVDATGGLSQQKDAKESSTEAKFGDVMKNIQAKYGARPEKPREIKKTLGKDDFLKIMITQMKNQDPTAPFKPEQMAAEMAQFTSVEQLQNVNQNLAKMADRNQPLERLAMTNLIGKTVTVDRDRFAHTEGTNESLGFALPRDAKQVKVALVADTGEVILETDLGPQKAGEGTFAWDGLKSNTLPAKNGNYMMRVEARDENDSPIPTTGQSQARVIGVSFEGNEPFFLVGDARSQQKVSMKNIIRIDEQGGAAPGAPGGASGFGAKPATPSLISFQKGVGSATISPGDLDSAAAEALARTNGQQPGGSGRPAGPAAPAMPRQELSQSAPVKAEGFPNGLQDADK